MPGPVYYAGPLFTDAERSWNLANARVLRSGSPQLEVLLPQEFCASFDTPPGGTPNFDGIFRACLEHLQRSAVVLAVLDGADADSGTCWEVGYAFARGIPIIGLRTDWRPAEDGVANCMLTRSCHAIVRRLDEAAAAMHTLLGSRLQPRERQASP